jgi:hypothetical protein
MCGRLNINEMLSQRISKSLGIDFNAQLNLDLRPTEQVATLVMHKPLSTRRFLGHTACMV